MDGTTSAGTGAAEGMVVALAAALATEQALAGPLEGRGVGVPAARGGFEPVDDVVRGSRCLAGERAADEDALDRLGHVQPGAAEWGVERHDAVLNEPQHERRGLVAAQVVEDQQHPQRWQALGRVNVTVSPACQRSQAARRSASVWAGGSGSVARIVVTSAWSQGCSTALALLVTPLTRTRPEAGWNRVRSLAVPWRMCS